MRKFATRLSGSSWLLWHGNLYKARYKIDDIESLIYNFEETYPKFKPLLKAVEEFRTYIVNKCVPHPEIMASGTEMVKP